MARRKKTQLAKIRSLSFLRSIRLTELQARKLRFEMIARPENHEKPFSAWKKLLDETADQIKNQNWKFLDGKILLSVAEGHFALHDVFANFLPENVQFSDEDRFDCLIWVLTLKAFEDNNARLLRECALCWQAFPHVAAEMNRRATDPKSKHLTSGFLLAALLYFTKSAEKDMIGADVMRNETMKILTERGWRRLPAQLKSKEDMGQTQADACDPSAAILAQGFETSVKNLKELSPMVGLEQWLNGIFNQGPLAIKRDIQDEHRKAQECFEDSIEFSGEAAKPSRRSPNIYDEEDHFEDNDVGPLEMEQLGLHIEEASFRAQWGRSEKDDRKIRDNLLDEYLGGHRGDRDLLMAHYRIDTTISKLARKRQQSREWVSRLAKEADKRFREWISTKKKA